MAREKKRVPKLRRLLRRIKACKPAREFYKDMTLSEAWKGLRKAAADDFSEYYAGYVNSYKPQHLEFFRGIVLGQLNGWEITSIRRAAIRLLGEHKVKNYLPVRLPKWLLDDWDGYES